MGSGTERYTGQFGGLTREAQDEFAAKSHERAAVAQKEGRFADEIAPVEIPQRKGDPILVEEDEGVRPETTAESLGRLKPAFDGDGSITAGNASQISDGAAAIIVTSRSKAEELSLTPVAELVSFGMVAGPDTSLLRQPSRAIKRALEPIDEACRTSGPLGGESPGRRGGSGIDEGSRDQRRHRERERRRDRFLGHPIGMSGARVLLTLINALSAQAVSGKPLCSLRVRRLA